MKYLELIPYKKASFWIGVVILVLIISFLIIFVFPGKIILPQSVSIGPLQIRLYGLCLALAVIAAAVLALKRAKSYNIARDSAESIFLVIIIAGFIGARLYHVFTALDFYLANPTLIPAVWNGGLSIYGAIIGGALGLWAYVKYNKIDVPILRVLDWLAPSVVLGQAIGRFGNMFNYEIYGVPTNLPWKMFVPPQFRVPPYELSSFVHPLFLYESLGCLLIAYTLLKLANRARPGALFLLWLLLYNGMRFFTEALRIDSSFIGPLRLNMIVAAILVVLSAIGLKYIYASTSSSRH